MAITDISLARLFNRDRIPIIKQSAKEAIKEKFGKESVGMKQRTIGYGNFAIFAIKPQSGIIITAPTAAQKWTERNRVDNMTEIWKSVPDYGSKYEVSNWGRVKNEKGNILKPFATHGGYFMIALCDNGVKTNIRLHRLVAKMFIPNPNDKTEVNHKNGIKTDNRVDNLEWCSKSENMIHAYLNGFQTKGAFNVRKVICLEDNKVYETIGEAARAYNIHRETVRSSCLRLCKGRKHTFRYFDGRKDENEG